MSAQRTGSGRNGERDSRPSYKTLVGALTPLSCRHLSAPHTSSFSSSSDEIVTRVSLEGRRLVRRGVDVRGRGGLVGRTVTEVVTSPGLEDQQYPERLAVVSASAQVLGQDACDGDVESGCVC